MDINRIEAFLQTYQKLNKDNLELLRNIYHPDIQFVDPLHSVTGLQALTEYFNNLYANVQSIEFIIDQSFEHDDRGFLYWTMIYRHSSLNGGKPITVSGHSHLKFQQQLVIFHQDYLDSNAMLFEHIPLIGYAIKYLKQRASQ
ncbi:nuclear transport factor 2 family protein [Paraglaciecola aquimarina]|uniref:Nuclear transport factor 2 family protein n=1 Tax=Paraglaciecola aquimarina TaxID=1235557 RepID=A0ABU3SXH9_9ALTE|nr:nuclear transport factor 2 family protein [Paraglaciecola aquimarina]MDU0354711.1 nuclear transport factor 2 family protein [Paraglaciecola aquimarina]